MRITRTAVSAAASVLILAGCQPVDEESLMQDAEETTAAAPVDASASPTVSVSEVFQTYDSTAKASTYDPAVPEGSSVQIEVEPEGEGTRFILIAKGLEPDRAYGVHLHTAPCGADPNDSGPHYQDKADPNQPSTDPAYANPENEVWLDLHTDADGGGSAQSDVDWKVRPGEAQSVVIHAEHTHTEPGKAGTAGDRLACVQVPL
ncbi:superoxide dismutase family protein [Nocardiopsis ansamitocini]|uniref:Superoxide dismutase copper/zinc binding domain-containing protein n=1 Tax=Nocardiopsis ansamitocini TaxID=1670832 RepID=A0A9W6PBI1_9ACTN|nr:superoxide dismutase family protein [Nocardiopsis ansamitocini]GLU50483.1 hypothetical protein Nans01_48340 [Nocardiopsis ansamitocini]